MDCEIFPLSCQVANVAEAIKEPTTIEVLTFVVSAIAAVATLVIALMNLLLLRRQHLLQVGNAVRSARLARAEYAVELKYEVRRRWMKSSGFPAPTPRERARQLENLSKLAAATDEETQPKLELWVDEVAGLLVKYSHDIHFFHEVNDIIEKTIDEWVEDPSKSGPPLLEIRHPEGEPEMTDAEGPTQNL